MNNLHLDFETYSEVDIMKEGAYKYAMHPSTEALMLSWKIDQGMTHLWAIAEGEPMPQRLQICLSNPQVLCHAFNANFERLIFYFILGIDISLHRWRCTMVRAYSYAFTGGLDQVLSEFLPQFQKDPEGKKLINRFSKPQPKNHNVSRWTHENDSEGWEKFKSYCIQDTEVEYELKQELNKYPYLEIENHYYAIDQRINDRGVPVDSQLITNAQELNSREKKLIKDELRGLTGLDNPNSNDQMRPWLADNGLKLPDMTKDTIRDALLNDPPPALVPILKLKQQLAKTSVTKWNSFSRCRGEDNRVRGMFQFAGASRTNRWAGRIVQLQNLARGGNTTDDPVTLADMLAADIEAISPLYGKPLMALSDCIRCAITAPEGKIFNVADLSSIESRVLGWISDCAKINQIFAEGLDTYKYFATILFGVPYDQVTKKQRNYCKPPVLGCGFLMGKDRLMGYAENMGIEMLEKDAQKAVSLFRYDLAPEVTQFWDWCKQAVFHTTQTGATVEGPHGLRTEAFGEFLFLFLPSGRHIAYHKPMIMNRRAPWGDVIPTFTFMGKDRLPPYGWVRLSAHPGFITENIVQATSRDIMLEWMDRAEQRGFNTILHAHDEIVAEENGDRLEELCSLIRQPISWAPGLLLDADGFLTKRYMKG